MKAIWKQVLCKTDRQAIDLPVGAKILDVQVQRGEWCLWYSCGVDLPLEKRYIAIYATGQEVEALNGDYIGTFQDGPFVWHVFEEDVW